MRYSTQTDSFSSFRSQFKYKSLNFKHPGSRKLGNLDWLSWWEQLHKLDKILKAPEDIGELILKSRVNGLKTEKYENLEK